MQPTNQKLDDGEIPNDAVKNLLDDELAQFECDRDFGIPWQQALREIRSSQDARRAQYRSS
ncbi:MAG: hypothetical protein H7Z14_13960 [Anaerolineae bacterium]|nr:hypothetical protein [Phycisphaerae bacterium]